MIDTKLVYLCIYIAECMTAWGYFSALYKKRYAVWITLIAYALGYTVAFVVFNYAYVWVNTSVFTIVNFILLYCFHSCSWRAGLFHAGMLTCLSIGLEFVIALIIGAVFGNFELYQSSALVLTIMGVCSKLLYFLATKICLAIARKANPVEKETGPVALLLSCFSLASICVMLVMFYIGLEVRLPVHMENLMLICAVILLFFNILLYVGYQYSQRIHQQYLSLQMAKQREASETVYFKALEERYEDQRVIIHDIRRHLTAIKGLAQNQEAQRVVDYVSNIESLPVLQNKVRYCANPMLNVVLSRYKEFCDEQGISFQVDVRDKEYDFLSPNDITVLFGNILENAVEAAQGTSKPYIELRVDAPTGTALFISLTNPCLIKPESDGSGSYRTRKADKERHGVGLKSVNTLVKKYGGSIKQEYDETTGLFHTMILL